MTTRTTLGAAVALAIAGCVPVAAMPLAPVAGTKAPVVLVRDGCGPDSRLNRFDECVPNGRRVFVEPRVVGPRVVAPVRLPPPCPRGYVRDPDPVRPLCYPRF